MTLFIIALTALSLAACNLTQINTPPAATMPPTQGSIPTQVLLPTATPLVVVTATLPAAATPTQAPSGTLAPAPSATSAPLPSATASVSKENLYAVIQVKPGNTLTVHQQAGSNSPAEATLQAQATGIQLTGKEAQAGEERWVEISLPGGKTGWVNSAYITEQVDLQAFCADPQVLALFNQLKEAVANQDGKLLSTLVSPAHGMNVQFLRGGNIANYNQEEAKVVFQTTYQMNWGIQPGSGLELKGTFHETVVPKLTDVLSQAYSPACNTVQLGGATYNYTPPPEWANIHYYSLYRPGPQGEELNWRTWLAGVEYVQNKPYLFYLVQLFWEP